MMGDPSLKVEPEVAAGGVATAPSGQVWDEDVTGTPGRATPTAEPASQACQGLEGRWALPAAACQGPRDPPPLTTPEMG